MGTEAASRHGGPTAGTATGRAGVPGWPGEGEPPPQLEHLPLPQLRAYRRGLAAEEGRVSYWRRLLQARIDLLGGADRPGRPRTDLLPGLLSGALSGRPHDRSRRPRAQPAPPLGSGEDPAADLPAGSALVRLPDLAALWARGVGPAGDPYAVDPTVGGDAGEQALLLAELRQAETELSAYRRLLHAQLDRATQELVRRYQREPALALAALPALPDGTG